MKVSVSLPEEDIDFLDEYARNTGAGSRSAVLQRAVRLLRATELGPAYAEAWQDWASSGNSEVWESVTGDGFDRSEDP